jgi:mRNA-degrading endonuclease toxin of MazEF toxin-antitoxin module
LRELSIWRLRVFAAQKTASGSTVRPLRILTALPRKLGQRRMHWLASSTRAPEAWTLTFNPDARPKRGQIWRPALGDGKKHAVVVISLDGRNLSDRASSVLVVPFGSYGTEGPTVLRMQPGETGQPEPSFLKAHFIQVLPKERLFDRLPRTLSAMQLREVVAMIRRAVDPDAQYEPPHL